MFDICLIAVLLFSECRNIWYSKYASVKVIPIVEAKVDLLVVDDLANPSRGRYSCRVAASTRFTWWQLDQEPSKTKTKK